MYTVFITSKLNVDYKRVRVIELSTKDERTTLEK